MVYCYMCVHLQDDMNKYGDGFRGGKEGDGELHGSNGAVAATDPSTAATPSVAGPTYTMDVIEGEWDGLLEESHGRQTAARVRASEPAAVEPVPASTQPTEAEAAALNKRQRRQEKKRLAEEREAAIRKAVCLRDPAVDRCLVSV